jgi:adenylate cyclase
MTAKPDEVDVLEALHRLAGSKALAGSGRQRALLQYLVTEEVQGRGERLKAYAIATKVLDRPADFDPQTDSIVRVEVGRLRKALELHYATDGTNDPLRILIEKGGYRPVFDRQNIWTPPEQPAPGTPAGARWALIGFAVAFAFAAALAIALGLGSMRSTPDAPSFQRLAILPFKADPGLPAAVAPLAGLQADLAARLSEFDWLSVVPLRTVPPSIRDAGFLHAVEVTLHITGDVLTATAHLIDGATGAVRWAATYDAVLPAGDILAHQRALAVRIATDIGRPFGALTATELDRLAAGDLETGPLTRCHLALLAYWQTYGTAERAEAFACLPLFQEAAATDAGASAGAAMLLFDRARAGGEDHSSALSEAKERANVALERAPRRMSARLAGYTAATCAGDSPRFRAVAGAAVRDQPHNPFLLSDVANKSALGFDDWANALPMMERARALNPEPQAWYALTPVVDALRRNDLPRAVALLAPYEDTPFLQLRLVSLAVAGRMADSARARRDLAMIDRPALELAQLIAVQCWSADVQSLLRPAIAKAVSLIR